MNRQYYRKPTAVDAFQWPDHKEGLEERLRSCLQLTCMEIEHDTPRHRGDLRLPSPGVVTLTFVGGRTIVLGATDWVVFEGGHVYYFPDDAFRKQFFHVDTQPAVVVAPNLEDLL